MDRKESFYVFLVTFLDLNSSNQFMLTLNAKCVRSSSTSFVHFILRMNKEKHGIAPFYIRINVNGARIAIILMLR